MKRTTLSPPSIRRVAFVCVLLLMVFEAWVIHVNYADYFAYVVDSESRFFTLVTFVCLLSSFALLFNFIKFSLSAGWFYKVLSFTIFALSLGIEYGYHKAIGRATNLTDIETAIETTADQKVTSVLMYLNFYALVPIGLFLILLILIESEKKEGLKQFVIANALTIALFAICPTLIDQQFPTLAVPAFYRTSTDLLFKGAAGGVLASNLTEATRRRPVKKPSLLADFRPSNNVVIVVDESVRGDHLSVNGYGRDTTPFLQKLAASGVLTNWGLAVSASTGSRFTYNAMIAGLTPDDFPDKTELKTSTFPTIFQYAKAMNYTTYFFDGQMNSYWGGNGDDKNFLDSWEGPTLISEGMTFDPWELDNKIAKKINKVIASSTGNLIFVFKHGSHVPYQYDFPPDAEMWQPSYRSADKFDIPSGGDLAAAANAYDNALHYNIDSFFKYLIDDYSNIPNNSVIIYTGDHGQTLFVNGRAAHGGSTKDEATVPLFIIGKLPPTVDTRYKASHQNIFPTVLDLIGYPAELRDWSAAPSLLRASAIDSKPRSFNPDLGRKIAFD